jgi:hypothetical protein
MRPKAIAQRVVYNLGRILMYGLLGALVSSAGMIFPLQEFQNMISIFLGVALLIIGFSGLQKFRVPLATNLVLKFTTTLKTIFSKFLRRKTILGVMVMGAINGLLPCGLSFIALTWCLTLKGPLDAFNFMLLFGAGTLPVMLGLTGTLPLLVRRLNWNIGKLTTSMIIFSGCVLIARVFIIHLPHARESAGGFMDIMLCR